MTIGYPTLVDQNLLMSEEIPTVVGHNVWTILFITNYFILLVLSSVRPHFALSDQHGVIVGRVSLQEKNFPSLLIFLAD